MDNFKIELEAMDCSSTDADQHKTKAYQYKGNLNTNSLFQQTATHSIYIFNTQFILIAVTNYVFSMCYSSLLPPQLYCNICSRVVLKKTFFILFGLVV